MPRRTRALPRPAGRARAPVLLLGAGTGEATCGILYLASYLRRHGVEAFVRLTDLDETDGELERSLAALLLHVRPRLVGLSLKWFHHLARARLIARTIKRLDPTVEVALGGNTATFFWQDLLAWDCVDHLVLGDGELPLLALCRGDTDPPNVLTRRDGSLPRRAPLAYVQGSTSEDIFYSHFDQLFLSQADASSYSGWVAPGKGCGENCLYCGGTRGMQQATFGRAVPFLRPLETVQADHREVVPRTWQLRYDFAGSTAHFLEQAWADVDLKRHAVTWFQWGAPAPGLLAALSRAFQRVYLVLDIGCFSELQRLEQRRRGLLKPCPTDAELLGIIDECRQHPNLELEVSGIAGLPFASDFTLAQERRLVERVLDLGCAVGSQRLEAQPGALVTEHPERFGMRTEARSCAEFLAYFEQREPGDTSVPMVRSLEPKLEAAVQRTSDEVDALVWARAAALRQVKVTRATRLVNAAVETREVSLGDWLGAYRVPARVAKEPVTVVRSVDGTGLACAPGVSVRRFSDPQLHQAADAVALLAVLEAFRRPTRVDAALARLGREARCDLTTARELIDHLAEGRFLAPA